jgi:hypothetical protein
VGVVQPELGVGIGVAAGVLGEAPVAAEQPELPERARLQRVEGEGGVGLAERLVLAARPAQQSDPQVAGPVVAVVAPQRPLRQLQGLGGAAGAARQAGQGEAGGVLPGGVPAGLVERVGGLAVAALHHQREAEVVGGLAVVGVGVAGREPGDRRAEEGLGRGELAAAVEQQAQGVVAAAVAGVAPQRLLVVGLGAVGGVAVLLEVQPVEVQLLARRDLRRRAGRLGRLGDGGRLIGERREGDKLAAARAHGQRQLLGPRPRRQRHAIEQGALGAQLHAALVEGRAAVGQRHLHGAGAGDIHADVGCVALDRQADGGVGRGV